MKKTKTNELSELAKQVLAEHLQEEFDNPIEISSFIRGLRDYLREECSIPWIITKEYTDNQVILQWHWRQNANKKKQFEYADN